MKAHRLIFGAVALWATTALPSWAEDLALILTNRSYDQMQNAPDAAQYRDYSDALRRAGFQVYGGQDWIARSMSQTAEDFRQALARSDVDRVVVVLSGRMAKGPGESWLLGRDANNVTALNVGQYGVSVNAVLQLLAAHPGKALVVMAPALRPATQVGAGMQGDAVDVTLPQGVTAMRGPADRALVVLRDRVLGAGIPLGQLARQQGTGVSLSGYLPDMQPLGGAGVGSVDQDGAYWDAVRDIATIEAYRAYMTRFPRGAHVSEARRLIEDILQRPNREAEAAEAALNLSREARREIQRQLSLLGFDTRGIDGVFGRGTRAAITAYQSSKGWIETGFVNAEQLTTLRRDADRRARELEEEERQRRAEEERRDREFWLSTGSTGSEEGLRTYLRRFPDGLYADEARSRLDEIDLRRRREADYQMRVAWDQARTADTIEAYRQYLSDYPNSDFSATARDRIEELETERSNRDQTEQDKAEEALVAGNAIARLLVEKTLKNVGFDPGPADGEFDKQTRRAIRQFQRASQLPVTGYVSQTTMVRLMSRTGR